MTRSFRRHGLTVAKFCLPLVILGWLLWSLDRQRLVELWQQPKNWWCLGGGFLRLLRSWGSILSLITLSIAYPFPGGSTARWPGAILRILIETIVGLFQVAQQLQRQDLQFVRR